MAKIICTIPQDSLSNDEILETQEQLAGAYSELFPESAKPTVFWSLLPSGQSYVAGQAGNIYLALVEVDEDLDQAVRENAMLSFTQTFAAAMNISFEKPMVTFVDSPKLGEYMKANRDRLHWLRKPLFLLTSIFHALSSSKKRGFASIRTNL